MQGNDGRHGYPFAVEHDSTGYAIGKRLLAGARQYIKRYFRSEIYRRDSVPNQAAKAMSASPSEAEVLSPSPNQTMAIRAPKTGSLLVMSETRLGEQFTVFIEQRIAGAVAVIPSETIAASLTRNCLSPTARRRCTPYARRSISAAISKTKAPQTLAHWRKLEHEKWSNFVHHPSGFFIVARVQCLRWRDCWRRGCYEPRHRCAATYTRNPNRDKRQRWLR